MERKLLILVVEDDATLRFLAKRQLSKLGYDCECVNDGAEAVKKTAERKYDLILMDVQMPVLDGLVATKQIRENEKGSPSTPIIAMTARNERLQCLDVGMDDFLLKPIELEQLYSTLKKWLAPIRKAATDLSTDATANVGSSDASS